MPKKKFSTAADQNRGPGTGHVPAGVTGRNVVILRRHTRPAGEEDKDRGEEGEEETGGPGEEEEGEGGSGAEEEVNPTTTTTVGIPGEQVEAQVSPPLVVPKE